MAQYDITTAGSKFQMYAGETGNLSFSPIDTTHFIAFHRYSNTEVRAQVFTVNGSYTISTSNTALTFLTTYTNGICSSQIDANHYICLYQKGDNPSNAQVMTVNTTTWAVTTASSLLNFETERGSSPNIVKVDTNHFIGYWSWTTSPYTSYKAYLQTFTVSTSTWAVTTAASSFVFETVSTSLVCMLMVDSNHFIMIRGGLNEDGFTQVFTVSTSTWAITTNGTPLEFDTQQFYYPTLSQIDTNHFLATWQGGASSVGYTQVLTVNTTTWAVTTAGSSLNFETQWYGYATTQKIDTNHFIHWWAGLDQDGFSQMFIVNTSTWAVSTSAVPFEFDTYNGYNLSSVKIDTDYYVDMWNEHDGSVYHSYLQTFKTEGPIVGPANLKTYNTNPLANIKTINTNPIANVKSLNTNV